MQHNNEMDKMKRREEKARQARQTAIEELQKKREEKRTKDKEISQQEIVIFLEVLSCILRSIFNIQNFIFLQTFICGQLVTWILVILETFGVIWTFAILQTYLQESGKISKQKSQTKPRTKQNRPGSSNSNRAAIKTDKQENSKNSNFRPATASSVGRKVDQIFEVGRSSSMSFERMTIYAIPNDLLTLSPLNCFSILYLNVYFATLKCRTGKAVSCHFGSELCALHTYPYR